MPEFHVAMVRGQWVEIDEEDRIQYIHAKCLKTPDSEKPSLQACIARFNEHLRMSRSRRGSPLKHEYDAEANMTWRCVEIDGRSQWVEADWSQEPPRKLWGFDSDSDDEYSYGQAPLKPKAATTQENSQQTDVRPKIVSLGETTFFDYSTHADDEELTVRFGEDSFLDEKESEKRARCFGFGGLTTIESSKETRLRRKLLAQISECHNCHSCFDREESFDDQARRKVSFGPITITEIPEEFVTTIDEREATENFAAAAEELEDSDDVMKTFDGLERGNDSSEPNKQPVDASNAATTAKEPTDIKPPRKTTIKFAPVIVVKESPANHLPILKIFPDFCTASKPIFRPDHQRQKATSRPTDTTNASTASRKASSQNRSETLTSFPEFVETLKPFTRADLERLRKRDSRYTPKGRSPLQKEGWCGEDVEEVRDNEVHQAPAGRSHVVWR